MPLRPILRSVALSGAASLQCLFVLNSSIACLTLARPPLKGVRYATESFTHQLYLPRCGIGRHRRCFRYVSRRLDRRDRRQRLREEHACMYCHTPHHARFRHCKSKLFSAYCQQDSTQTPRNLLDLASDWEQDARRIRALLHIEDEWFWRYATLSGGQQKRLQIACALYAHPDVLVMDEPTNDLDAQTRDIVKKRLLRLTVLVSSSLTTEICWIAL